MSLTHASWRTATASVLVAVAPLVGFRRYFASEITADIQQRQVRLAELRSAAAQAGATAVRLPQLRSLVSDLEGRVEAFESALPAQQGLAGILEDVEALAARSNLTVRRLVPQPSKPQALYVESSYKLHVEGQYDDLTTFFQRIAEGTAITGVRDLAITASAQAGEHGPLKAECVLSTFAMHDAASPAAAGSPTSPTPSETTDDEPRKTSSGGRDPFVDPAKPAPGTSPPADAPAGIRGVRVDDIVVKGIVKDSHGFQALVQASGRRTYIIRSGERLLDGVVRAVTSEAVILSRTSASRRPPTSPQEVVKRLRPTAPRERVR